MESFEKDPQLRDLPTPSRLRPVAIVAYWLPLGVVGLVLNFFLFEGLQIGWIVRLLAIGVLLAAVVRSNGVLVLIAIQTSLILRETSRSTMVHGANSFVYCLSALALVVFVASFRIQFPKIRNTICRWFEPVEIGEELADRYGDVEKSEPQDIQGILGGIKVISIWAIVVLVAMLAFTHLPINEKNKSDWFARSIAMGGYVWPGPTMLTVAIGVLVLINEWNKRTRLPSQSRMYARSVQLGLQYRDLRMILRRGLRSKGKVSKTMGQNGTGRLTESSPSDLQQPYEQERRGDHVLGT